MPTTKEDLPSTIKRSSDKVQRTYAKALDSAHDQYDSEERAHRVAYDAVKHIARKEGDRWVLKRESGPSDPQAAQSTPQSRTQPKRTRGGVDANASREELYAQAKRAGIEGRSKMNKRQLVNALERHSKRSTKRARSG